jgi:DtxR family transcriptional regulator, Mn-dependent transcriptional regulator
MTPLIDATEMYLRTVWELEEEGITPLRARLVERLGVSAPAVSETVARLEAEHLMEVAPDRTLRLTAQGREIATSVMRKHRLVELLLTDVIGLDWEQVHNEACRWEHVISDDVEKRLVELLDSPPSCPHGNPIPGLATDDPGPLTPLSDAASKGGPAVVERISEKLQSDVEVMRVLREHGIRPGTTLATSDEGEHIAVEVDGVRLKLSRDTASHVYVRG